MKHASFAFLCTLSLLAACTQPPHAGAPDATGVQKSGAPTAQAPQPQTTPALLTPAQAVDQVHLSDLHLNVAGTVPAWAISLVDDRGQFLPGALRFGVPIQLRSPVNFSTSLKATSDTQGAALLAHQLEEVGDAALVPLLTGDGQTVGMLRVPLLNRQQGAANPNYVLFERPSARLKTTADVATSAGTAESHVMAVALGSGGDHYDPFDFHWLVAPAVKGGTPLLVASGLPALITQRGEVIPAEQLSTQSLGHLSAVTADQASASLSKYQPAHAGQQ